MFPGCSLTGAFLYPAYGSYKTLSHRPSSERDLERWLMYWSVLGCIIATEYVAEWIVRWSVVSFRFHFFFWGGLFVPSQVVADDDPYDSRNVIGFPFIGRSRHRSSFIWLYPRHKYVNLGHFCPPAFPPPPLFFLVYDN